MNTKTCWCDIIEDSWGRFGCTGQRPGVLPTMCPVHGDVLAGDAAFCAEETKPGDPPRILQRAEWAREARAARAWPEPKPGGDTR